jgi:2-keto-4-pentenoate hydratase/2-oxohepta-3-ene-1,7-dioic acid hydratase in catechol pathway
MMSKAFEDLCASYVVYNDFTARDFERCKARQFIICAIVDCIRKPYRKVRE